MNNTETNQQTKSHNQAQQKKLAQQHLNKAIDHYLHRNRVEETKQQLFHMLWYCFESETVDHLTHLERSSFFFAYNEVCQLLDAINYTHSSPLTNAG